MMSLSALVPEINSATKVTGICDDSRKVKAGDLFIAISGQRYSASQMIEDIGEIDVAAVLCDANEVVEAVDLPVFKVTNLAERRGEMASKFYGEPSKSLFVVAVTGTNGKTSCSQFIAHAFDKRCGVIGTMGNGFLPELKDAGLTTPDAISLQKMLSSILADGAGAVAIEASSHGLVQGRLNGVAINTAVFTNITRDHLDYHETFDAYKAAKKLLFQWPGLETAVLNLDDNFATDIAASLADDVRCLTYSLENMHADIFCLRLDFSLDGISADVQTPWGEVDIRSPLIGDFNVSNLLAVIGVLGSAGLSAVEMSRRISAISNVAGRMEQIHLQKGAVAIIDYAHTPNALENAIKAARVHCQGKLWCVMGCGGDRDVGKRPIMGEIAARLADYTIITDDNPRTEPSDEIIEHVLAGVPPKTVVQTEPNRAKAISLALESAEKGDLILIAGKGHETYQEINGVRYDFSDHEEVAAFESTYRDASLVQQETRKVIVGFGKTGVSVAEYCVRHGLPFAITDDASEPPRLAEFERTVLVPVEFAPLQSFQFKPGDQLVVSPGVPLTHPELGKAQALGATLENDVQLFSQLCRRPLALITGSNGKSTVTHFVGQLLNAAGINTGVGGNIGTPALDLLEDDFDAHVLEVSSYQLEIADSCQADVAVLLNLSPDHLDRYSSLDDYYSAKTNVFVGCKTAIVNREIEFDLDLSLTVKFITFGGDAPVEEGHYGLLEHDGQRYLMRGSHALLNVADLPVTGKHNQVNILAAIAIAEAVGAPIDQLIEGVKSLKGLAHRCEPVVNARIEAINDSKSTNPISTLTAIESFAEAGRTITLLLGGISKGADFSVLQVALNSHVDVCYVYGKDRDLIAAALGGNVNLQVSLDDCLQDIAANANDPGLLLFSPGCASFDQFENFEARGAHFKALVQELFK